MNKFVKIVVYVPSTHADVVRKALGEAGAGVIGNYDHCSSSSKSVGRFRPNENAHPFIGKAHELKEVEEDMVEVTCERDKAKGAIEAMKKVHPYEEVAFDIYPLISEEEL
jgi:hypothetical protein